MPPSPLSPDNVVAEHIGQFNRLVVAQSAALELVRKIWDAGAPSMDYRQRPYYLAHGRAFLGRERLGEDGTIDCSSLRFAVLPKSVPAPGSQRRFVPFGTLISSHTSPGNISISDGHAVVKMREYRCMTYHTKNFHPFPYIQEVGNRPQNGQISTLMEICPLAS